MLENYSNSLKLFFVSIIMIINVKVKVSSGKNEVEKVDNENYLVFLKSPPENNKANIELIKLLDKYFDAKEIKIKTGKTSKRKRVEVLK